MATMTGDGARDYWVAESGRATGGRDSLGFSSRCATTLAAATARTSPLSMKRPVGRVTGSVEIIPTTDPTDCALSRQTGRAMAAVGITRRSG